MYTRAANRCGVCQLCYNRFTLMMRTRWRLQCVFWYNRHLCKLRSASVEATSGHGELRSAVTVATTGYDGATTTMLRPASLFAESSGTFCCIGGRTTWGTNAATADLLQRAATASQRAELQAGGQGGRATRHYKTFCIGRKKEHVRKARSAGYNRKD